MANQRRSTIVFVVARALRGPGDVRGCRGCRSSSVSLPPPPCQNHLGTSTEGTSTELGSVPSAVDLSRRSGQRSPVRACATDEPLHPRREFNSFQRGSIGSPPESQRLVVQSLPLPFRALGHRAPANSRVATRRGATLQGLPKGRFHTPLLLKNTYSRSPIKSGARTA